MNSCPEVEPAYWGQTGYYPGVAPCDYQNGYMDPYDPRHCYDWWQGARTYLQNQSSALTLFLQHMPAPFPSYILQYLQFLHTELLGVDQRLHQLANHIFRVPFVEQHIPYIQPNTRQSRAAVTFQRVVPFVERQMQTRMANKKMKTQRRLEFMLRFMVAFVQKVVPDLTLRWSGRKQNLEVLETKCRDALDQHEQQLLQFLLAYQNFHKPCDEIPYDVQSWVRFVLDGMQIFQKPKRTRFEQLKEAFVYFALQDSTFVADITKIIDERARNRDIYCDSSSTSSEDRIAPRTSRRGRRPKVPDPNNLEEFPALAKDNKDNEQCE
jgi:hypothetical protein